MTPEAERLVPTRWTEDGEGLIILDQTELPANEVYRELRTLDAVREAIRSLRVIGSSSWNAPVDDVDIDLARSSLKQDE